MSTQNIKDEARRLHVKLTRKLPKSPKRVPKSPKELKRDTEKHKKYVQTHPPKPCKKSTVAINVKHAHHGAPCKDGEERTKNYCVKTLSPFDAKKTKWVRTLTPYPNKLVTIACPK